MNEELKTPYRQIRARWDAETVTVYQAYHPGIAEYAAEHGRFPDSWSRSRMTWIKPSFLWMMYRSGWAAKPGQERVLAIRVARGGFDRALRNACPSHWDRAVHPEREQWAERLRATTVRVQWDPERDLALRPLPYRSLQLGLAGPATRSYADEWLVSIEDVTGLAHEIHALTRAGRPDEAARLLPHEEPYPLDPATAVLVGATPQSQPEAGTVR